MEIITLADGSRIRVRTEEVAPQHKSVTATAPAVAQVEAETSPRTKKLAPKKSAPAAEADAPADESTPEE